MVLTGSGCFASAQVLALRSGAVASRSGTQMLMLDEVAELLQGTAPVASDRQAATRSATRPLRAGTLDDVCEAELDPGTAARRFAQAPPAAVVWDPCRPAQRRS